MQSRGISRGVPLFWHFGIWGDALAISPLLAWIVATYAWRWAAKDLRKAFCFSAAATLGMGYFWALGDTNSAHSIDHVTTAAGILHLVYMWLAVSILLLFFFATEGLDRQAIALVGVILVAQVFIGAHLALGAVQQFHDLDWFPEHPLRQPLSWTVFALTAGLVVARARVLRGRVLD